MVVELPCWEIRQLSLSKEEGRREISPFSSSKLLDQLSQFILMSPGDRTEAHTDLFYLVLPQSKKTNFTSR